MVRELKRTTLSLPAELLERVDTAIRLGRARSRNAFAAAAIERDLAAREREELDAQFADMANDVGYLAESIQLNEEFERASAEALRVAEGRKRSAAMSMTLGWMRRRARSRPGGGKS